MKNLIFPLVLVVLSSCAEETATPEEELTQVDIFMSDPMAVQRGEALFAGSCAAFCHTLEPPQPDNDASFLFDCEWNHGEDEEDIYDVIVNGIPDTRMVAYGNNFPEGDDDVWKIVAYLRSNQRSC